MGMKTPFEGRPLMLKQIEEHERLQQFSEIGRAHQACGGAMLPASGALRNPAYSTLCSRGLFMGRGHFVSFKVVGLKPYRTIKHGFSPIPRKRRDDATRQLERAQ